MLFRTAAQFHQATQSYLRIQPWRASAAARRAQPSMGDRIGRLGLPQALRATLPSSHFAKAAPFWNRRAWALPSSAREPFTAKASCAIAMYTSYSSAMRCPIINRFRLKSEILEAITNLHRPKTVGSGAKWIFQTGL